VGTEASANADLSAGGPAIDRVEAAAYRVPTDAPESGAVDCLQADVTRCGGITGFLKAASLAEAHRNPLSGHTAPAEHAHVCCATEPIRHVEYFHDHARLESMLFDGAPEPEDGALRPDRSRPGMGLTFKRADAERYKV